MNENQNNNQQKSNQNKPANLRREGLFEMSKGKVVTYLGHSSYVRIPTGASIIGRESFKDNQFVEVVYFPKSVLSVRDNAFENCINLSKVIFEGRKIAWGKNCFKGCTNLKEYVNTKAYPVDIVGNVKLNGFVTVNTKENNVSETPTIKVTDTLIDTVFDLVSTYYQGEFENTVDEKLEIFIDISLRQHKASLTLWNNQREEWENILRLQKIAYDKLIDRQKKELLKYLQMGIDESYDCLDNQAKEYKDLLKTQKIDRRVFLDEFREKQELLNKNILGENYQSKSWGFEDNFFE